MNVPYISTLPPLPPRPEDSHKGTFGRVLVIAGSRGMSGAACLSGLGALRGGAGLVTVAVPRDIQALVAGVEPSYLTAGLPDDEHGRFHRDAVDELVELARHNTAVALGPGFGTSHDLRTLVDRLYREVTCPLVIDADGLNLLAQLSKSLPNAPATAPRILTPHPGEFARLLGTDIASVQADREAQAVAFAAQHQVVLLLKGHATIITDGTRIAVNTTGNSGMATGGTGDVLTGLIAALLAQNLPPFEAAQLAAHLHGLAGDLAATEFSQPGLIASDLPRYLGRAWQQLGSR